MSSNQLELRVTLDDQDAFTVLTRLVDHNIWDITRAKHKWPTPTEAPMTWLGFMAWTAARRTGQIDPSVTWELFLTKCIGVENVAEEDAGPADPIQPGPGPG